MGRARTLLARRRGSGWRRIVSVVGDDEPGRRIREALEAGQDRPGGLEVVGGDTALTVAAVRPDGERAFLTDLGCSGELARRCSPGTGRVSGMRARSRSSGRRTFPVSTPARSPRRSRRYEPPARGACSIRAGARLRSRGRHGHRPHPRCLRPLSAQPRRGSGDTGERGLAGMLRALRDRCPGTVIVKCGAEGSAFLDAHAVVVVEALPVEVDNAVGAGDVFNAGAISGLLETGDPLSAAIRGTAAASLYISRASSRFATLHDWQRVAPEVRVRAH